MLEIHRKWAYMYIGFSSVCSLRKVALSRSYSFSLILLSEKGYTCITNDLQVTKSVRPATRTDRVYITVSVLNKHHHYHP